MSLASQFLTGSSGYSGKSGYSGVGSQGTSGVSGKSGYSGVTGSAGASGISGYSGTSGTSGKSGYSGVTGGAGLSGYSGVGTSGVSGKSGYSGVQGPQGVSGYSGLDGTSVVLKGGVADFASLPAYPGPIAGDLWITADTGDGWVADGVSSWTNAGPIQGPQGTTGISGYSGSVGASGYSGLDGASGYSGLDGASGYSGVGGVDGTSGYSGVAGIPGTVVSSDTPPPFPVEGLLWFDTSSGVEYRYIFDGDTYQWFASSSPTRVGSTGASGYSGIQGIPGAIISSDVAPDPAVEGLIWYDTTSGIEYRYIYDGTSYQWVAAASPSRVGGQGISGYSGVNGAPGSIVSSDTPPGSPFEGLLWYDTSAGVEYRYIYDGTSYQWVASASPTRIGASGYSGFASMSYGTPASRSAPGTTGTVQWDENYVYVCISTNTWKRTLISTW